VTLEDIRSQTLEIKAKTSRRLAVNAPRTKFGSIACRLGRDQLRATALPSLAQPTTPMPLQSNLDGGRPKATFCTSPRQTTKSANNSDQESLLGYTQCSVRGGSAQIVPLGARAKANGLNRENHQVANTNESKCLPRRADAPPTGPGWIPRDQARR
jgi:hypothetical protein